MRLLLLLLLSLCCGGSKQGLQLIHATSQSWVAGIRGGGAGINYEFKFKALASSKDLKFEGLWIKDDFVSFKVCKPFPAMPADGFARKDTLLLHATRFHQVDGFVPPVTEVRKPPFPYKGEALITFTLKGKSKFIEIPQITKLRKENYE